MGMRKTSGADALREVLPREHARDAAGLSQQLREGDTEQRRWAARDLAAHTSAAKVLGEQLLRETDPSVREAIFTTLKAQATEAAASVLLPLLRSEDAGLRNGAIEALSSMPQVVAPKVSRLLSDGDPDVRIFTVNLLGELQHPQVPEWLLQVLQQEPTVNVVAAALEVMAEVGSPAHLSALQQVKRRFVDDPFIGFAADLAAERIEAP